MKRTKYEFAILFCFLSLFLIEPVITTIRAKDAGSIVAMSVALSLMLLCIVLSVVKPKKLPF